MPRSLLSRRLLLSLPGLVLLSSCCLGECVGSPESVLVYFRFSADTLAGGRGFRRAELRSAYVVSYRDARFTQPRDTQRVVPRPAGSTLYLNADRHDFSLPFADDSLTSFIGSYRLVVPAAGRRYDISQHMVPTKRGPCRNGCREAQGVSFLLNGQPVVFATPSLLPADAVILNR